MIHLNIRNANARSEILEALGRSSTGAVSLFAVAESYAEVYGVATDEAVLTTEAAMNELEKTRRIICSTGADPVIRRAPRNS